MKVAQWGWFLAVTGLLGIGTWNVTYLAIAAFQDGLTEVGILLGLTAVGLVCGMFRGVVVALFGE